MPFELRVGADHVFKLLVLKRYEKFLAEHPRLALGMAIGGGCLAIVGLAGVPNDIENWAAAFRFIGSDAGRWLFVVAGVIVVAAAALAQKSHEATEVNSPPLGPQKRLQVMDDLFYPSADPRRELGEECRAFAVKVRIWVEEYEARRIPSIASAAQEIRAANSGLNMETAYEQARKHVERKLEKEYELKLREEGLRLFDLAREHDAILARYRREIEHPSAYSLEEVANIFRAIARRLDVDVAEPESIPKSKYLADFLDGMIREGIELRGVLAEPVKPEETKPGIWRIDGGVPEGWWDEVDDFGARAWNLLHAERPALLSTHSEGHNSYVRRESQREEEDAEHASKPGQRTKPQEVLAFFNATRSGPYQHMDALLEGLAAARRQLGAETGE